MRVRGKDLVVEGRLVRIGRLAAEGFEFVDDPVAMVAELARIGGVDLFTFLPRLPATAPAYDYPAEWDNVAAMPISTYDHWWTRQIDAKTRNMVRRAEKRGLVVREVPFDDVLVRGIWEIYNECPVRQGRPFPHYGKDLEAVREMSATFPETSFFIGAFLEQRLIGFAKLTVDDARSQAAIMHILSSVEHRDKAAANALIAESVKACVKRAIPYLVYSKFSYWKNRADNLSDFKKRNGFERVDVPRYYASLTNVGRIALRIGLQHGLRNHLPESVVATLRSLRSRWYGRRVGITARVPWHMM